MYDSTCISFRTVLAAAAWAPPRLATTPTPTAQWTPSHVLYSALRCLHIAKNFIATLSKPPADPATRPNNSRQIGNPIQPRLLHQRSSCTSTCTGAMPSGVLTRLGIVVLSGLQVRSKLPDSGSAIRMARHGLLGGRRCADAQRQSPPGSLLEAPRTCVPF